MARSVDEGFSTYLSLLTPSDFDTQQAQSHRNSIEAVLKSNFGMTHFFRSGSFGFGTSVKDYSDIDYFAVVPGTSLKTNSHMSLADFLRVLDGRFPRTGVKIDSPAIVLPFGSNAGEKHEIVSAYLIETKAGYRVFGIPNRAGGWLRASPEAHAAYVSYVDKKLNGKAKPLIRLIKSWKYHNGVPVRSFYIEVAITNYAATQSSIAYDFDVFLGLSYLLRLQLNAIEDPMGTSAAIEAGTAVERVQAYPMLQAACENAQRARDAASKANIALAFHYWDKVFGGRFPAYY